MVHYKFGKGDVSIETTKLVNQDPLSFHTLIDSLGVEIRVKLDNEVIKDLEGT